MLAVGEVVAVVDGHAAALTFHPEVVGESWWHRSWLTGAGLLPARDHDTGVA